MGRFNMAAKTHMTIAGGYFFDYFFNNLIPELYESDSSEKERCMAAYEKAADFFKGEESKSSASKCMAKVGQVCVKLRSILRYICPCLDSSGNGAVSKGCRGIRRDWCL